jgi:hypothetical protein
MPRLLSARSRLVRVRTAKVLVQQLACDIVLALALVSRDS